MSAGFQLLLRHEVAHGLDGEVGEKQHG